MSRIHDDAKVRRAPWTFFFVSMVLMRRATFAQKYEHTYAPPVTHLQIISSHQPHRIGRHGPLHGV
jgi:hypothetical protein